MEFLKSKDLELNPAGYLVSKTSGKPVTHAGFVNQQRAAEYVIKLAEAIKGKNFKPGKVDSLEAIKAEVLAAINKEQTTQYLAIPAKPTNKINDELVQFALDFDKYQDSKVVVEQINQIMNQFNKINDVETVGEYFSEGLVKLASIYTIEQILVAVQANTEKLG